MSEPCQRHGEMLKRSVRFLKEARRSVWAWPRQKMPERFDMYSDSDHAWLSFDPPVNVEQSLTLRTTLGGELVQHTGPDRYVERRE